MKVVGFARLQTANRIPVTSSSWEENNIIYHFCAFAGGHFLFLAIKVNTVFNRNILSFTFCPLLSSFFLLRALWLHASFSYRMVLM